MTASRYQTGLFMGTLEEFSADHKCEWCWALLLCEDWGVSILERLGCLVGGWRW